MRPGEHDIGIKSGKRLQTIGAAFPITIDGLYLKGQNGFISVSHGRSNCCTFAPPIYLFILLSTLPYGFQN